MSPVDQLFRDLNVVYLERSRVADPRLKAYDWSRSPYAEANRDEFSRLTARYGEGLRQGRRARLQVQEAGPGLGWGLFAAEPLAPDDLVGEYCGVLQPVSEAPPDHKVGGHYLSDYAWNYPDELPDGSEFEVNALYEGNELRFVNHSYQPNTAVDHTLVDGLFVTFFRVLKPVAAGEQLTVDYGEEYWSGGFRTRVDL